MSKSCFLSLGAALAAIWAQPAEAQDTKTWQGSCMCEKRDEDGAMQLVILLTDANRAEIAKRLAAGEGDDAASVMFESNMCVDPKLCGRGLVVTAGITKVKINDKRLDDQPYDAGKMSTAKVLTIFGKGK